MLTLRKTTLVLLLGLFSAATLWGQTSEQNTGYIFGVNDTTTVEDTLVFDIDKNIANQLLPLDTILQIAYEHSPSIKHADAMLKVSRYNLRRNRMLIFQGISAFYNYTLGDQLIIVTGTSSINSSSYANGYRYGVNVSIPLSTILGQSAFMKLGKAEIEAARWRKEEVKLGVRREVQRLYVNMIEGQGKLNVRSADAQIALMAATVAEEELAQGTISPDEYSNTRTRYAIAESNVEGERANFMRAFLDFEAMVGVDIAYLKRVKTPTTKPNTPK